MQVGVKFYIDQAQGLIYNPDSLPYGTDVAHVLDKGFNQEFWDSRFHV